MVVKASIVNHKKIDLSSLKDVDSVYVGYPDGSTRENSELTNAQIAFLNTEGTRPNKVAGEIHSIMAGEKESYSNALNAYIRSHGDPRWHIPPRPFLQPSIEENMDKITKYLNNISIKSIENQSIKDELTKLGLTAVNIVRSFIRNYPANGLEPNAPSTIKRKGDDHPLRGKTGQLLRGVTYIIEK